MEGCVCIYIRMCIFEQTCGASMAPMRATAEATEWPVLRTCMCMVGVGRGGERNGVCG